MKKIAFIILGGLLLILTGCGNTTPKMSSMQLREMTTKEIQGEYKDVFKAVMTVLQDQDYILNNTDFNSGLITGEKEVEKETTAGDVLTILFVDMAHSVKSKVNVSATVNEVTKDRSKVRLNIQEKITETRTYKNSEKSQSVKDAAIYKTLFEQITIETERIKAIK